MCNPGSLTTEGASFLGLNLTSADFPQALARLQGSGPDPEAQGRVQSAHRAGAEASKPLHRHDLHICICSQMVSRRSLTSCACAQLDRAQAEAL